MKSSLLPILQKAFPAESVISYDTTTQIVQANAEGHLVSVLLDDVDVETGMNKTKSCFVKTMDANHHYEKKKNSWPDFRRTLIYLRTEVRFYQEILPDLLFDLPSDESSSSSVNMFTPEIYASYYNFDGLLTEEERATDDPMQGPVNVDWNTSISTSPAVDACIDDGGAAHTDAINSKGGYIVMETIPETQYLQDSPITIQQAKKALETIGAFHASAWENQELLKKAQNRLSRGSYHLKTRNRKEVAGLIDAWKQFTTAFGIIDNDNDTNLGRRIQDLAEFVCHETSPEPVDKYATLSHGDCKAMNFFLPVNENNNNNINSKDNQDTVDNKDRGVILVDFASTGVGLGMSDVAMLIHHAVRPEHLDNGGEMMLIDHYLNNLNSLLSLNQQKQGLHHDSSHPIYPKEIALWHYKLAVVDYFRFFLGRFWVSATPESFEKKKHNKNTALINRDRDAAFAFLQRARKYVTEIEKVKVGKESSKATRTK